MFDDYQICPYTGLRSFTEEESIYFKGRDEHIDQATKLLEKNKFLMLTGASGDGKSSLVYAGIIPNARAGFLKSTHSTWAVIDFRPERSPFKNLCKSVALQLGIENVSTVEAELSHGFSALVDLYRSSSLYFDPSQDSGEGSKSAERRAANLILLADQFEEFFTNPENYFNGVPSQESNLVVNLLLETARIALEEKLPIFVVCTMRSDYIGQCSAFRGLPEAIGLSQFFVPRLNRIQLQEVIEEPAVLSGNRITKRLVERLIHDLTEGVDQLPILQHALNQIWKAADNGNEEMDLIHYARVGGMAGDELPDEDILRFNQWFLELPAKIKDCYDRPRLQNVINTHANKLFAIAADQYNQRESEHLSDEQARLIIKVTFICLTKIDQSRAVRNRMTLLEITNILDRPELNLHTVAAVIRLFRESGNTFVKPFIEEGEETELAPDSVLDITHESLIRNWELLNQWAYEEFELYNTFLDFRQSLGRWVESGRSRGFLLPIGSLTYFENWATQLRPSKFWIQRYLGEELEPQEKLMQSQQILEDTNQFLHQSARRHRITRTVMKYGPARIAVVLALIIVFSLSSFFYYDSYNRRNDQVLDRWKKESFELLQEKNVNYDSKAANLVLLERLEPGSMAESLNQLPVSQQLMLSVAVGSETLAYTKGKSSTVTLERIQYADQVYKNSKGQLQSSERLRFLNDQIRLLQYLEYYHLSSQVQEWLDYYAKESGRLILDLFGQDNSVGWDVNEINSGIQLVLNHEGWTSDEVRQLLGQISPFEGPLSEPIASFYSLQNQWEIGYNSSFSSNGLYQELGYLYGYVGQTEFTLRCLDTLYKYHPDYQPYADNSYNIAAYLLNQNDDSHLEALVNHYCYLTNQDPVRYLHRFLDHVGLISNYTTSTFRVSPPTFLINHNTNLELLSSDRKERVFEFVEKYFMATITNPDELQFNLAILYKKWGVNRLKPKFHRQEEIGEGDYGLLEKSLAIYRRMDRDFLDGTIQVNFSTQSVTIPRKHLFLYPDVLPFEAPFEPRTRWTYYDTGIFLKFLLDKNLISQLYSNPFELALITRWGHFYLLGREWDLVTLNLGIETIERLEEQLSAHPLSSQIEMAAFKLMLCRDYFASGQDELGLEYAQQLEPTDFRNIFNSMGDFGLPKQYTLNMGLEIYVKLHQLGETEMAERLISDISNPKNSASFHAYLAAQWFLNGEDEKGNEELEIAIQQSQSETDDKIFDFDPSRLMIGFALASQGSEEGLEQASNWIKNLNYSIKTRAITYVSKALTQQDRYSLAESSFPNYLSRDNRMIGLTDLFYTLDLKENQETEWRTYDYFRFMFTSRMVFFEVDDL